MEDSSNSTTDSQTEESQATSSSDESTTDSNGNFSGFDSSALSDDSFNPDSTPDFGIDFGGSNDNNSFGFGENLFSDFDFGDFSDSGSDDYTYDNTSYSNNKSEPTMTVDEVYGKSTETGVSGNQPTVENQGDYDASSNEKSNVDTSTLGKQDNISVTPTEVTENKGTVKNDTIQSVEGLDFQQKDKESQDVLEAKKNRDEAEAKDKANQTRDQLKSDAEKNKTDAFKAGKSEAEKAYNNEDAAWQQNLQEQKDQIDTFKQKIEDTKVEIEYYESRIAEGKTGNIGFLDSAKTELAYDTKTLETLQTSYDKMEQQYNGWKNDSKSKVENGEMVETPAAKAKEEANKAFEAAQKEREYAVIKQWNDRSKEYVNRDIDAAIMGLKNAKPGSKEYKDAMNELGNIIYDHHLQFMYPQETIKALMNVNPEGLKLVINNLYDSQTQRFKDAYDAIINSKESKETKAHAIDVFNDVSESRNHVKDAADKLAANPNDPDAIKTYIDAVNTYNEKIENALKDGSISKTDFNKAFTEWIADAVNFKVPSADGTKQNFAEFAIKQAVKSPEIAAGMYKAKAKDYEEKGHKVLAAIENAKSRMVMTWLGSKFTFADNQVRNQFNQMAKTTMRATYAAYNNVLNDPNATPEQKEEAFKAIQQANSLMTASTALKASTGFWSGIGDSMKDGVYGKTDPKTLNAYQKTLNMADNLAKITLGLGVTPGANKAYQNMYYMAGDKVNKSFLFNKDFDGDGFALCQEYGNNAAVGMIAGAGELATGVVMFFNPATASIGLNLVIGSVKTFTNGLYGVQKDARKSQQYNREVLSYLGEAKDIAEETGNKEAVDSISDGITQIENFQLKSDEVGNLDNWLEGSGSNTADNGKFNQALSYDEWLKLIEADPTMQEYAKKLIAEKKEK